MVVISRRALLGTVAGTAAAGVALLLLAFGLSEWRGWGFHEDGTELPRLRQVLALEQGLAVADVGAGNGDLTVALASEVGPSGRLYATDIDAGSLDRVRAAAAAAGLANVTLVRSQVDDSRLPPNCCDAIVLRRVYHHLTDAAAINASLLRALRPGGVLAVIDFPAPLSWPPPLNHGADAKRVVDEVVASGFVPVRLIEDWPGRGPLSSYCAVFTKPRSSQAGK